MERTSSPAGSSGENPLLPVMEVMQGGDPAAICAKYGISREVLEKRIEAYQVSSRRMALSENLMVRRVGRNELCPCGSGKKYKKCCLGKHEEARRNLPADRLQQIEEQAKLKEKLDEDVKKGFDLLYSQDFGKARQLAEVLLKSYPEDDRAHDILVNSYLAGADYESALHASRLRWQVAQEEKAFFQENGYFKREGIEGGKLVHFYPPSTWLETFWISQCARAYQDMYPVEEDSPLKKMAEKLKAANDMKRFPSRREEGYEARRKALEPILKDLEAEGVAAIPYLLPLTYCFSWASLFVPDLLSSCGTDTSILLLAELSMFRIPYFAQKCLAGLEKFGQSAVPRIEEVLTKNSAFDDLKVGLITVLGSIHTPESFGILAKLIDHEKPYLVRWAGQALEKHNNPDALPFLNKAQERLAGLNQVAGAIRDLAGDQAG